MRMHHDSRMTEYRNPYGALTLGEEVRLALDVWDAPNAHVQLRTWSNAKETLYDMSVSEADGERTRYETVIQADTAGIVWYHFIATTADGRTLRYGVQEGRMGGEGAASEWEPPSFRLSVHAPAAFPPAWYESASDYLGGLTSACDPVELAKTLHEQYPSSLYRDAFPWHLDDPHCSFMPWEGGDATELCSLARNEFRCFSIDGDVCGFWCRSNDGATLCALFNTSFDHSREVGIPLVGEEVSELVAGYGLEIIGSDEADQLPKPQSPVASRYARVQLIPLGWALLHFHDRKRLQKELHPGLGVLVHITSLPAEKDDESGGKLGPATRRFVDWLEQMGVRYWQVLPVNPTDEYGSPYAGISAFAGNDLLLDDTEAIGEVDLDDPDLKAEYQNFCQREADWLEPYACFMAIRRKMGEGIAWQDWPEGCRRFDPTLLEGDAELARVAEACRRTQFAFDRQWRSLHAYASERGVTIIGDMPIYVSADSADVWANPQLFQLNGEGKPEMVAGCPPDAFSQDGQIWGNPVYDWETLKAQGFNWWLRRFERAFQLYDVLRLDHFIGFSRYFSVPAGKTARAGAYRVGPGFELFREAFRSFGPLPIMAEDLGLITPGVRSLMSACGFPGMDIVQFVDGNDPLGWYAPRPDKVAYTGTHDNQTLVGYCQMRYPWLDARETARDIAGKVVACSAPVAILPLQDLIGLGDEARMNVPGVPEGNWTWQANANELESASAFTRELVLLKKA